MSVRRFKSAPKRARRSNFEQLESRTLFAIAFAENLLVSVDATTLPAGTATDVVNTGTLGGTFSATGGGETVPVIAAPMRNATSGTKGIRFDNNDYLQLVTGAGSTDLITAPEGITGADPTTSIEAWVWNPGIATEETVLAWGQRGVDGKNMSFNYGNQNDWGAMGHWGTADIGWGPTVPAAKQWHYVAYTFDGDVQKVYIDGVMTNSEDISDRPLDITPNTAINLATQLNDDGATPTPDLRGSLTIGRARIHDGVLTDEQIAANYNAEKADFVEPVIVAPAPKLLVNVDATGLPAGEAANVVNNGTLGGVFGIGPTGDATTTPVIATPVGATGGTRGIRFDGSDFLQLVTAPDGTTLITAPSSITGGDPSETIEAWVWNPNIDGEETIASWGYRGGPNGTNNSFNYGNNNDWGAMGHWGPQDIGWGPTVPSAQHWHHVAYTYDGATQKIYIDGQPANSEFLDYGNINIHPNTAITLAAQLDDVTGIVTGGLRGNLTIGKVRIYDGTLTDAQIKANFDADKAGFVEPTFPAAPPASKLIDIDATTRPAGTAADIVNTGSLGGFFGATGGAENTPVIDTPVAGATGGTRGIRFDGTDYLQLVSEAGTNNLITAPASITGPDATESIEAWVWNPNIPGEETLVSWGYRGGPEGSNNSFNYGNNGQWGAVGHWGNQDQGWGPTAPAAQQWHHVAYTFDGAVGRIYIDGVKTDTDILGTDAIDIHPDTAITLAAQLDDAVGAVTGGLRGSLTIGKMRVYEGVLTDTQIATNFNAEKAQFVDPVVAPAALAVRPTHRYSFNDAAGDAGTGTTVIDSIGTANGTVLGDGATWNGTELVLPGGSSETQAYVDLPNGLISGNGVAKGGTGQVTIEGWVHHTANQSWSRIYDIGSSTANDGNEVTGPGGAGNGVDFFMLTAQTGADPIHRIEVTANSDEDGTGNHFEDVFGNGFDQDLHFVTTWDEATGQVRYYENGRQVVSFHSPIPISDINDINVWLGRSNFLADANFQGEYDEVRIYDRALTPQEVLGNFQAGPEVVNTGVAPKAAVTQVFVNGPGLSSGTTTGAAGFRTKAGIDPVFGYPVPAGTAQTKSIPWTSGVNQIALRFDADVASRLQQGDLVIRGASTATYTVSNFTYDAATKTGVWTLSAPIFNDKVRLFLDDAQVGGLDGEWVDNGDAYPSGNGTAGGDFSFRLNVLRGDATQDGTVNAQDLAYVKQRLNKTAANPGTTGATYTAFGDLTMDGSINAQDLSAAKQRLNNKLPTADPATALLFSSRAISR